MDRDLHRDHNYLEFEVRNMATVYAWRRTGVESPCHVLVLEMHLLGIHRALYVLEDLHRWNAFLFEYEARLRGLVLEFSMN
jgi:hypothetical protein